MIPLETEEQYEHAPTTIPEARSTNCPPYVLIFCILVRRRLDMTRQKKKFASQMTIPRMDLVPTRGVLMEAPVMYLLIA
jgi:hypothetical protein